MPRAAAPVALLVLAVACGGGAAGSGAAATPTSPSPSPTISTTAACGTFTASLTRTPQIVNGSACSAANSSVVLLNLKDSGGQPFGACSGTIVAPRAILTAGHCLADGVASIKVFLGTGAEIVAASFVRNPDYNETANSTLFDSGVVLMSDDLPRTPIPLLTSRDGVIGETAILAGWGNDQSQNAATLRAGVTTLTAVDGNVLQTQFGPNTSSVCQGDSGGPLMLNQGGTWAIAGIISANSTLACAFGANFYASIRNSDIQSFVLAHVPDAGRR